MSCKPIKVSFVTLYQHRIYNTILALFFLLHYGEGFSQVFNFSESFKTIARKTADNRYLAWSSADSLGQSDILNLSHGEIYIYDTLTDSVIRLTDNTFSDNSPRINGEYLVWAGSDGTAIQVMMYHFPTATKKQLTTGNKNNYNIHVNGNYVVWNAWKKTNNLNFYDLRTNKAEKFGRPWDMSPVNCDHLVVTYGWKNFLKIVPYIFNRMSNYENTIIMLHNLANGKRKKIKTTGMAPKIKDNYIIWGQYIHNISENVTVKIFPDSLSHHDNQGATFINNKIVLCQGTYENSGTYRLFSYHLTTHKLMEIPNSEFDFRPGADRAFLTNNYVVWRSKLKQNGKYEVTLYHLTEKTTEHYELPYHEMSIIFRPIRE